MRKLLEYMFYKSNDALERLSNTNCDSEDEVCVNINGRGKL